ncbi:MAG: hypothetical protein B7Y33_05675, partial [Hydrogenophilales bacterium 16-62-9]
MLVAQAERAALVQPQPHADVEAERVAGVHFTNDFGSHSGDRHAIFVDICEGDRGIDVALDVPRVIDAAEKHHRIGGQRHAQAGLQAVEA